VRALPWAIAISASLHAGAFAWVELRNEPQVVRIPAPAPAPEPPRDPEPVAVVLLDDHAGVALPARVGPQA